MIGYIYTLEVETLDVDGRPEETNEYKVVVEEPRVSLALDAFRTDPPEGDWRIVSAKDVEFVRVGEGFGGF